MFGLFKKSSSGIPVVDKVWMSQKAKFDACVAMSAVQPETLFVTWFESTFYKLCDAFNLAGSSAHIVMARDLVSQQTNGKMMVFAEHYPLPAKEQHLFKTLGLQEVPVLSSLDEPLFITFGGEGIIEMMKKLGMKEDEVVGHSMVTKSIRRAQEKIERKVKIENTADSQEEWFQKNVQGRS